MSLSRCQRYLFGWIGRRLWSSSWAGVPSIAGPCTAEQPAKDDECWPRPANTPPPAGAARGHQRSLPYWLPTHGGCARSPTGGPPGSVPVARGRRSHRPCPVRSAPACRQGWESQSASGWTTGRMGTPTTPMVSRGGRQQLVVAAVGGDMPAAPVAGLGPGHQVAVGDVAPAGRAQHRGAVEVGPGRPIVQAGAPPLVLGLGCCLDMTMVDLGLTASHP